jgi:predicted Fe-Mo cluster-binding NifX family protein
MKIAVSTSGDSPAAALDARFGRAPKFLIHDTESGAYTSIDNEQNLNAAQGAGIQSAQNVARAGAEAVITGHTGPKAFAVLAQAGIAVYLSDAPTVADALAALAAGTLKRQESADVEGHW